MCSIKFAQKFWHKRKFWQISFLNTCDVKIHFYICNTVSLNWVLDEFAVNFRRERFRLNINIVKGNHRHFCQILGRINTRLPFIKFFLLVFIILNIGIAPRILDSLKSCLFVCSVAVTDSIWRLCKENATVLIVKENFADKLFKIAVFSLFTQSFKNVTDKNIGCGFAVIKPCFKWKHSIHKSTRIAEILFLKFKFKIGNYGFKLFFIESVWLKFS